MIRRTLLLGAVLATAAATPAAAGTYTVRACGIGGQAQPNESWVLDGGRTVATDPRCGSSPTDSIGLTAGPGARLGGNTAATMTFTAPEGATVASFVLNRRWVLRGTPEGDANRPYLLYSVGGLPFAGAGAYGAQVRDRLNQQGEWAGYDGGDVDLANVRPKPSFPALATYNGGQRSLTLRLGCFGAEQVCRVPAGGLAENALVGARVDVLENAPPAVTVLPEGLFAAGPRSGSDPVVVTAADGVGIRRVELLDYTFVTPEAPDPFIVGGEDYEATPNDAGGRCSYTRPLPCPSLPRETFTPTALAAGKAKLAVRVTDAAGNQTVSPAVDVVTTTPSDRGVPNGTPAASAGTLTAGVGGKPRVRARLGSTVTVGGQLVDGSGTPITGAELKIGVADKGGGGFYQPRKPVRTDAEGRWSYPLEAIKSRRLIVGWTAYANDSKATLRSLVRVDVPGRATLKAPRSVRRGATFTLRGRLAGAPPAGSGILLRAQVRQGKRWTTIGRAKAKRRAYRVKARLRSGGTKRVRIVLVSRGQWPYVDGKTKTVRVKAR